MAIQKQGELVHRAFEQLKDFQTGKEQLLKTNFAAIDRHIGGMLPGDVAVLSALSGVGKSELAFRLRESIMDPKINKKAKDFVWLNYNLEVKQFSVVLRSIARKTGQKKRDILFSEFSDEQKATVKDLYEDAQDGRFFVSQDPTTAEDFYNQTKEFAEENKHKAAIIVSFDHVALTEGSNKQKAIEDLIFFVNKLKLEYHNIYFFLISQLNRTILTRLGEKDNTSAPRTSDLYASSSIDFVSSFNICLYDAYRLGIEEYLYFNPTRHQHLEKYFTVPDKKGKVSFTTENLIFVHSLKVRESDYSYINIDVIEKDITEEEEEFMKNQQIRTLPKHPSSLPEFLKKEEKNTDQKDMEGNRPSNNDFDEIPF